ncbi:MAG: hypothetical protein M3N33_08855 [Actinomycetota bacterium]|nr:hypothetical protein [Actinomycetota bacterium]
MGAGDIATCGESGDEATADLLDGIPGTVFTTGNNAYESGTAASWGRHKDRTRPVPGNHDYHTAGGLPATSATSGRPLATRRRATTPTTSVGGTS